MKTIDYQSYQHLSFDLWLTLIKSNPSFKQKRNELFGDFFSLQHSAQKISETIRYYDVFCNLCNEKTGLNIDTYEIYLLILNALDVDVSALNTQILDEFYQATETLFLDYKPVLLDPETPAFFAKMKQEGLGINILSNTGFIKSYTLDKVLDFYALMPSLDFAIYSDVHKISKPNPKIFDLVYEQAQQKQKLNKNQILHIGDNPQADFAGAKAYGFSALLI